MSVLDVRAAIVTGLKAVLGPKVTVESHRGRFDDAEEIKRIAMRAPAVLVAALRIPLEEAGGLSILPVTWGLFVVTRDQGNTLRGDVAVALTEACELAVRDNDWGRDDVNTPTAIDARNLYATAIDKLGVSLWGITFVQQMTVPTVDQVTYGGLHPFEIFHQDIDMAPADGVIDITETDHLPQ